jgi:hypothetical protein
MKRNILLISFVGLSCVFQSCSEERLTPDVQEKKTVQGIFQGEKVNLSDGITQNLLDEKPEEYFANLMKTNNSARIFEEKDLGISMKELADFFEKQSEKYPQFDMQKMEIKRFNILKKDFPDIKTEDDAFFISGKIVEFYDVLLRKDLKENLEFLKNKSRKLKVSDAYDNGNAMEKNYFAMHPQAGGAVVWASSNGDQWCYEKFGASANIQGNNNLNAYRHAIWAMASVSRMLATGMPKNDALGKTRDFLTLHEMVYLGHTNGVKPSALPNTLLILHAQWGLSQTNPNAMDLSNNAIGRSLIENQASKPLFGPWNGIDKTSIMNTMATKVASGVSYRQSGNIISDYHGGNWNALASNIYGGSTTPLYRID